MPRKSADQHMSTQTSDHKDSKLKHGRRQAARPVQFWRINTGDDKQHVQYNFGQVAWNLTEPWLDINTLKVRWCHV
jgi:hypothetical protein